MSGRRKEPPRRKFGLTTTFGGEPELMGEFYVAAARLAVLRRDGRRPSPGRLINAFALRVVRMSDRELLETTAAMLTDLEEYMAGGKLRPKGRRRA